MRPSLLTLAQAPLAAAQPCVVAVALAGLGAVALIAAGAGPPANAAAALIGGFAGFALYHAAFGFTAAWRLMVLDRRGAGLRAQMLLFAVACALAYPLLAYGERFGIATGGFVIPFGVGSAVGAFLFGIGMQFAGGCGSGTLFTSGGGSSRMMLTLLFFIIGSALGTWHFAWWAALPRFEPVSYLEVLGAPLALATTFILLAAIHRASVLIERRAWGEVEPVGRTVSLLAGPWSKPLGALALAAVSIATLLALGRPWGITSGFALWGAKAFYAVGIPVETWAYWSGARLPELTERSIFADATSVMNFGIILGAMIASGLAGRYHPTARIGLVPTLTAVAAGLVMGYGARLAYGCTIGGYLGGVVSGSLSGWWWLIFGFLGSVLGTRAKAALGV